MAASLGYLEAIAFARGYKAMLAGLKLTKIILDFNNHSEVDKTMSREEILKLMDAAYADLRQQLIETT